VCGEHLDNEAVEDRIPSVEVCGDYLTVEVLRVS
jgi:hypothetical protein